MRAVQSGLNFYDLQLRVAELSGLTQYRTDDDDNRAIPPDDPNKLDRVKRAINDAAREFFRAVDPKLNQTHKWTWLKESITIELDPEGDGPLNIESDSRRYRLPSHVAGHCTRADWSSPGYPGRMIYVVHAEQVRRHWAMHPEATGAPLYIAVVASPEAKRTGERMPMELIVAPAPSDSSTFSVRAEFPVRTDPLVLDADYGVWPADDDLTIAWWAASLLKFGDQQYERFETRRMESLIASIEADKGRAPANLTKRHITLPEAAVRVEFDGTQIL